MLDKITHETMTTDAGPDRPGILARLGRAGLQAFVMVLVLAAGVFAMQRLVATAPERAGKVVTPTIYPVTALELVPADNRAIIQVFGQAVSARTVDLRPLVSGEITAISPQLTAGSRVKAGDMLVEIDRFAYEGALIEAKANFAQANAAVAENEARIVSEKSQLAEARQQLELANKDMERAEALRRSGSLTAKELENRSLLISQRSQAVSLRESNLVVESARLQQQKAAAERLAWKVSQAERALSDTVLKAPFDGVVRSSTAEIGKSVGASDILASIYSDEKLEARFSLTNAQYGRLVTDEEPLVGRQVEAVWTIGGKRFAYAGHIDRVGAEIAAARGGVELFADLDRGNDALGLRPGAFLEISLPDTLYRSSFLVPEAAIYDGHYVYVVEQDVLKRREVVIADYSASGVIITGGLQAGQKVLTTRLSEASEGLAVRVAGN